MGDHSKIEWTEATWNPVRGCSRVSEGCRHCYAERHAARFSGAGLPFEGFAITGTDGPHWTGRVELVRDKLTEPLKWKRPRRIFVNSMSDLFHEALDDDSIAVVFAVMACCPQHTLQVLTKRPERMQAWAAASEPLVRHVVRINRLRGELPGDPDNLGITWPLPNVWLGVSVEDQATADSRIPLLLETPAAVRFVSAEPLLGPVSLARFEADICLSCDGLGELGGNYFADDGMSPCRDCDGTGHNMNNPGLDWVIVGGESGPGARPMHPDWARGLRIQCDAAGMAFFFKQWGAWAPLADPIDDGCMHPAMKLDGVTMCRYGKHTAGRLLDGREHNAMPTAPTRVLA